MALFVGVAPYTAIQVPVLSISEAPTGQMVELQGPFLKDLADRRGITIGTLGIESPWESLATDQYYPTLMREFNLIVTFNSMKEILPFDRATYSFARLDNIVGFGQQNGLRLRENPLIWGEDLPDWLLNGTFSRDELIGILRDYVTTLVGRYKGKISEWEVVNEAFTASGGYEDNVWFRGIGPEYIELAFRAARAADPTATLLYNDYQNESAGAKADAIYRMAADFKARGVPLDAIGLEMHLHDGYPWYPTPTKDGVLANMRRFGALGLAVNVTEIDVNTYYMTGTPDEKRIRQARIYRDMLSACLESSVCKSFTLWGFTDAHSWLFGPAYVRPGQAEAPLILDEHYNPKPAYYSLRDTLLAGG